MQADLADKIRSANLEVHRREAAIYDAVHPELFGSFEQHRINRDVDLVLSRLPAERPPHVLDIGCGTGNLTLKFLKRGCRVKAVDLSSEMIQRLESKLDPSERARVELLVGDAEQTVADDQTLGSWDVIAFSSVLHHLPDYRRVLLLAWRQLRPGGLLYVCHEPWHSPAIQRGWPKRAAANLLNLLDVLYIYARKSLIYAIQSLRDRRRFARIDYSWSDYHLQHGIEAELLLHELEKGGAVTLLFETGRVHYLTALSVLDHVLKISVPSQFRFIVQRPDSLT
jgi:ubiquinone/menaquinone biosynthesis C-methylase UbiE